MPRVYNYVFDGDLGVRFFFIISGFLITWLMLAEQSRTGTVSLKNFYIRRAFRILPVYSALLAVLFAFQCLTPFSQPPRAWLANLTFTTNFANVSRPAQHLWSLAVEEQFYLLWPILFVGLGLAVKSRLAARVLLAPILIAPVFRLVVYKHYYPSSLSLLFLHSSFFRYFDCLAAGCGCAILLAGNFETVRACLAKFMVAVPLLAFGLIVLPDILGLLAIPGRIIEMSGYSLQALGFALLLLQSVCFPQLKCYRWLNWSAVRHIGVLSYSIYIWQAIFFAPPATRGMENVGWHAVPGALVMALVVAHVSYYGLERPFLNLRARFREKKSPRVESQSSPAASIKDASPCARAETPTAS